MSAYEAHTVAKPRAHHHAAAVQNDDEQVPQHDVRAGAHEHGAEGAVGMARRG